jgi:hypothetical protein
VIEVNSSPNLFLSALTLNSNVLKDGKVLIEIFDYPGKKSVK